MMRNKAFREIVTFCLLSAALYSAYTVLILGISFVAGMSDASDVSDMAAWVALSVAVAVEARFLMMERV